MALNQLLIKDRSSGAIHSVEGTTVWDYDPVRNEAIVTYNEPLPFGPQTAPSLAPGADPLRRFLNAVSDRYRITLEGEGTVAGRAVFELRLASTTREPIGTDKLIWVDRETCLVLREQNVTPSGEVIGGTGGFTAVRYDHLHRKRPDVPRIPSNAVVTVNRYGPLEELSAAAGVPPVEPSPLPADWRLHHAYLTMYPDRGTGPMKALSWYYYSGDRTRLSVAVWSPPRLRSGSRGDAVLGSGVTGHFFTEPFNGWAGIQWADGVRSYNLAGPGLSDSQLVNLAKSMILGAKAQAQTLLELH